MSSSTGTILVTGGFGKTSSQVAQVLHSRGYSALVGSRQGQAGVPAPHKGVQFDWLDKASWSNPFTADHNITGVYIVAPHLPDPYPVLKEFVKFAQDKGTKRFVFLGASKFPTATLAEGYADFTQWLAASGLGWATLEPTWFQGMLISFGSAV
jgi:festuclavine dehydrogenase